MFTFCRPRQKEELQDLSDDQACQVVLQDLSAGTEQWQKETEDVPPDRRKTNRYDYQTGEQLQS
jgi:hypothetical protein